MIEEGHPLRKMSLPEVEAEIQELRKTDVGEYDQLTAEASERFAFAAKLANQLVNDQLMGKGEDVQYENVVAIVSAGPALCSAALVALSETLVAAIRAVGGPDIGPEGLAEIWERQIDKMAEEADE